MNRVTIPERGDRRAVDLFVEKGRMGFQLGKFPLVPLEKTETEDKT